MSIKGLMAPEKMVWRAAEGRRAASKRELEESG